jgi:hypothetical protein
MSSTVSPKARARCDGSSNGISARGGRPIGCAHTPPSSVSPPRSGRKGGAVAEPRGAVVVSEDRDLVPVARAPPQNLGAAHVEGRGDEDAHASVRDLVERRQQRLALAGDERALREPERT